MKAKIEVRRQTIQGLRELADAGLIVFQLSRHTDGAELSDADALIDDTYDSIDMQVRKTGKSADGIPLSAAALKCWRAVTADITRTYPLGMRRVVHSEPILGTRSGRRVLLSCGHSTVVHGGLGLPTDASISLCPICRVKGD